MLECVGQHYDHWEPDKAKNIFGTFNLIHFIVIGLLPYLYMSNLRQELITAENTFLFQNSNWSISSGENSIKTNDFSENPLPEKEPNFISDMHAE